MAGWTSAGNLKGPKGDTGATGAQGLQGPAGTNGTNGTNGARGSLWFKGTGAPGTIAGAQANDFYLDTASGDIYQYS